MDRPALRLDNDKAGGGYNIYNAKGKVIVITKMRGDVL